MLGDVATGADGGRGDKGAMVAGAATGPPYTTGLHITNRVNPAEAAAPSCWAARFTGLFSQQGEKKRKSGGEAGPLEATAWVALLLWLGADSVQVAVQTEHPPAITPPNATEGVACRPPLSAFVLLLFGLLFLAGGPSFQGGPVFFWPNSPRFLIFPGRGSHRGVCGGSSTSVLATRHGAWQGSMPTSA
jgi:hypothetical protein